MLKRPLFAFFCLYFASYGFSHTIVVGEDYPTKTIKEAIQKAEPGDTILVKKGHYKEGTILIEKRVCLLGEGLPVVDGEKKHEIFAINADGVVVKGFRVVHSGTDILRDTAGIRVFNHSGIIIENNELDDNFFAVFIQNSNRCVIRNNKISAYKENERDSGDGVHCWKSDSLSIYANAISGHRDGIYLEFVTASTIVGNTSNNNIRYGLHFMFSNDDVYRGNSFANNGSGVAVMFSKRVEMLDNRFEGNWGDASYGLLLKEISQGRISGNDFRKNTSALFMDGATGFTIEKNYFTENGWGLKIQANCIENTIQGNNFIRNTFDVSTNGASSLNTFEGNYWSKYEGYDLNRDGRGDLPFRPLSLFAVLTEYNSSVMLLFRSFMMTLLEQAERLFPSITPDSLIDVSPRMRPVPR